MNYVFSFRKTIKITMLIVPLIAICFIASGIVFSIIRPWSDAVLVLDREHPSPVTVLIGTESGLTYESDGETISEYRKDKYLLLPSNETVAILKVGSNPLHVDKSEGGLVGFLATIAFLIACSYFSRYIPLKKEVGI